MVEASRRRYVRPVRVFRMRLDGSGFRGPAGGFRWGGQGVWRSPVQFEAVIGRYAVAPPAVGKREGRGWVTDVVFQHRTAAGRETLPEYRMSVFAGRLSVRSSHVCIPPRKGGCSVSDRASCRFGAPKTDFALGVAGGRKLRRFFYEGEEPASAEGTGQRTHMAKTASPRVRLVLATGNSPLSYDHEPSGTELQVKLAHSRG